MKCRMLAAGAASVLSLTIVAFVLPIQQFLSVTFVDALGLQLNNLSEVLLRTGLLMAIFYLGTSVMQILHLQLLSVGYIYIL